MHRVKEIRDLLAIPIAWSKAPGQASCSAVLDNESCRLTLNDFPDEPLYTVHWRGQKLDLDDAPEAWTIPTT